MITPAKALDRGKPFTVKVTEDLDGFLHPWLYGPKTPPIPNHPDRVVNPVQS
ncbi:hypothetical protein OG762_06620 [Streptomyces sp. NBC_01136]|uniref:hypothetical protein n=1 Tax=unclassified Streptomyces TaxID=2593676 RepID=UPI0032553840|nr:hypothetical protein OG762_06620 [Streptomyces sp. NBC_01136]